MSTLVTLLMSLSVPLALRVLAGVGFSIVTFTGVTEFWSGLLVIAQNNWSTLPVVVLQLASLSGIPQFLGMIAGAYATRMTIWIAVSATRFIVK
jgi:hypothetical protein